MPRIPRIAVPGIALHVVQRGNNRQAVFFHESDYISYLDLLFESAARYDVSVHSFGCMTNHVHILLTPWVAEGMRDEEVETFRRCARKGLPAGSEHFRPEIEEALARRIGDGRRGRPPKGL